MKPLLLIPIAGLGSRFKREGFQQPKQMLPLRPGATTFSESLASIDLESFEVRVVARREQLDGDGLRNFLSEELRGKDFKLFEISEKTQGSVDTCLQVLDDSDLERQLHIFTMDVAFEPVYKPGIFGDKCSGGILTFKSNSNSYSYVQTTTEGIALRTAEKEVISDQALVGIYYFARTGDFISAALEMIKAEDTTRGEYYIAPLYNRLIEAGAEIHAKQIDKMHLFGIPEEYFFYKTFSQKTRCRGKTIAIVSDHSGFRMKQRIETALTKIGPSHEVSFHDFGTFSTEDTDYGSFVSRAIQALDEGIVDLIIASCRSGQGVNIFANAFPQILGTLIYSADSARLAVEHNCSNFFSIPAAIWESCSDEELVRVLEEIVESSFDGGRHQLRMMQTVFEKSRKN
jgi:RpiB/LacA/LacB family sugar-phosphate isomerase